MAIGQKEPVKKVAAPQPPRGQGTSVWLDTPVLAGAGTGHYFSPLKKLFAGCACWGALLGAPLPSRAGEPGVVGIRLLDGGGNVRWALTGPNGRNEVVAFQASSLNNKGLQAAS